MKNLLFLICFGVIFCSCTKDEITSVSNDYTFSCVTGADTLETMYGFQLCFGDSLSQDGQYLLDFDYVVFKQYQSEVPDSIIVPKRIIDSLSGKYCMMFAFYKQGGNSVFINSSFYINHNGMIYSECAHSGISTPFLITE